MIQSYEQMPIATYGKILRVIRNEQMNDFDKEIAMLSIISDKSEEELISIPLVDLKAITSKCGYLLEQPKPAKVKDEYQVGDFTLCPMKRIERISAGQFISFQELAKAHKGRNDVEYLPQILSCFLIPKGKKYSNDYGDFDIYDVQDAIRDHLSIVDALALLAFFLVSVKQSQANILRFLEWKLRLTWTKTPQQKELKMMQLKMIRGFRDSLKNGDGQSI